MSSGGWQTFTTAEGREYFVNKDTGVTTWDKPDELKTEKDRSAGGDWVWCPHPVEGYIPAKVLEKSGKKLVVQTEDGERQTVDESGALRLEYSMLKKECDDLVQMEKIDEGMIAHNLKKRFAMNKIYTNIGTILIAMNPFKALPLYTPEIVDQYRNKGMRQLPPHIYDIADASYRAMCEVAGSSSYCNQSILISGESGAGKTVSTKHVLAYLAQVAGTTDESIKDRILAANPLLESFGNAKTIVNDNSSRFGKWVEIFFDESRRICGARINNYLLEKARVTYQANGERNFHIFYQLCKGCNTTQKAKYKLMPAEQNKYMFGGKCSTVNQMDDNQEFKDAQEAMDIVGFTEEEKDVTMQLVSGIIHCGNLEYKADDSEGAVVSNPDELNLAAQLFCVSPKELETAVTKKTLIVKGQDPVVMPLNPTKAAHNAAAMSKMLYNNLFDWLVDRVNAFISPVGGRDVDLMFIGVLDIFGFEIFEKNSFEQLCINYTNEKLQQHFNRHTFKLEEQLYRAEEIKFTHVEFIDNQPCLDLIEMRPHGILFVLDEELVVPDGSDKGFVSKLHEKHFKKHERYDKNIKNPNIFVIKHYAGVVSYDVNGFLEKNKDVLEYDLLRLMQSTTLPFLKQMFPEIDTKQRRTSLGTQFKGQLTALMDVLNSTAPHYVRCIRSNNEKKPGKCDGLSTLLQLRYSGVFEAVRIRQSGYPFRYRHEEFVRRYHCLDSTVKGSSAKEICKNLFQSPIINENFPPDAMQLGLTRVLYRAEQHRTLELLRSVEVWKRAVKCQTAFRVFRAKKLLAKMIEFDKYLKAAIQRRDLDYLEEVLAQCEDIWFPMRSLKPARELRDKMKEERRISAALKTLQNADPEERYDEIMKIIYAAEKIDMHSPLLSAVQERVKTVRERRETIEHLRKGCENFDKSMLESAIATATRVGLYEAEVAKAREVLREIEAEERVVRELDAAMLRSDGDVSSLRAACEEAQSFTFRTASGRALLAKAQVFLRLRECLCGDFKLLETWESLATALEEAKALKLDVLDVAKAQQRIQLRSRLEALAKKLLYCTEECDQKGLEEALEDEMRLELEDSPWHDVLGRARDVLAAITALEVAMATDGDVGTLSAAISKADKLGFRETKGRSQLLCAEAVLSLRKALKASFHTIADWEAAENALLAAEAVGANSPDVQAGQARRVVRKRLEECTSRLERGISTCERGDLEAELAEASRLNMQRTPWGPSLERATVVFGVICEMEAALARQDGDIGQLQIAIDRAVELNFRASGGKLLLERCEATLSLRVALKASFLTIGDYDALEMSLKVAEGLRMTSSEVAAGQLKRKHRKESEATAEKLRKGIDRCERGKLQKALARADELIMSKSPWGDVFEQASVVLQAIKDLEAAMARSDGDVLRLAKAIKRAESLGFRNNGGAELLEVAETTLLLRKCLASDFMRIEDWDAVEEVLERAERLRMTSIEAQSASDRRSLRREIEDTVCRLRTASFDCARDELSSALERASNLKICDTPWASEVVRAKDVYECILELEAAICKSETRTARLDAAISRAVKLKFRESRGNDLLMRAEAMRSIRIALRGDFTRLSAWNTLEQALQSVDGLKMVCPEASTARERQVLRKELETLSASLASLSAKCDRDALERAVAEGNRLSMLSTPWAPALQQAIPVLEVIIQLEEEVTNTSLDVAALKRVISNAEALGFMECGGAGLLLLAKATLRLRVALQGPFLTVDAWNEVEEALDVAEEVGLDNEDTDVARARIVLREQLSAASVSLVRDTHACDRHGLEAGVAKAEALGMEQSPWADTLEEASMVLKCMKALQSSIERSGETELLKTSISQATELGFSASGGAELLRRAKGTLLLRTCMKANWTRLEAWDALEQAIRQAAALGLESVEMDSARKRAELRQHLEHGASQLTKASKSCIRSDLEAAIRDTKSLGIAHSPWAPAYKHAVAILAAVVGLESAIATWDKDHAVLEAAIAKADALNIRATQGRELILRAEGTLLLRVALDEDFSSANHYDAVEAAYAHAKSLEIKSVEMKAAKKKLVLRNKMEELLESMQEAMEDCDRDGLEQALEDAHELDMANSPWAEVCEQAEEHLEELVQTFAMLEEGTELVDEEILTLAVKKARKLGFNGDELNDAILLRDRILFLKKVTHEALVFYDVPVLQKCLQRAESIGLEAYYIDNARRMLAAVSANAIPPVPERFFDCYLPPEVRPFSLRDFQNLRDPAQYASASRSFMTSEKKIARLQEGMCYWDANPMPSSLTALDGEVLVEALSFNKRVLFFMGDAKKGDKRRPGDLQISLRQEYVDGPSALRDEIYCQLIKQLTGNPSADSMSRGWMLMQTAIQTFPPSQKFEVYLEHFLRQEAPETETCKRRDWLNWMRTTIFSPPSLARWPREGSWMLHR